MAKFGHVFISGLLWIAIAIGIGILGLWVKSHGGIWTAVGWTVAIVGFGFASLSFMHLRRITSYTIKGVRMMRDDPERFAELKRDYEQAVSRVDAGD